ncbi:phage head closure protein [Yersinia bercovieri]|uniref:phage head closure protein n=1 Tax=Yersinia bercovieri TaxID=634 RepID=UPI001CFD26B1|nr:phage head closure protein [Yersinia bercovieri]MCB5301163.1 phage head closure protein [Yersinia bercovieri]
MKAGKLRYRVTVQKRASGVLPSGQPVTDWEKLISVRADITDISGRELVSSGAELSETTVRIWMRRYPAFPVTSANRILHEPPTGTGEIYDIVSVIGGENNTRLELLCKRGVKS